MPRKAKKSKTAGEPPYIDTPEKKKLYSLITERPRQISNFKQLAALLREAGEYKGAAAILMRGIKRHPEDRDIRMHLAKTYAAAGDNRRAKNLFKKLILERPDDYLAYEKMDRLLRDEGKYREAVELYSGIARRNPLKERSHERIHFLLVEKLKDLRGGAENLRAAIKNFGPSYRRCKDLGRLCAKMGNWRAASRNYTKALELNKDDADLMGLLGWALAESGDHDRAEKCFSRIEKTFQGAVGMIELFLRLDRLDDAEARIKSLKQRYPDNSRIAIGGAELKLKRGDAGAALRLCLEALPRVPSYFAYEQARAHALLSEIYRVLGDKKASVLHGEAAAALKEGPDAYTALITIAEKKIKTRSLDQARALLERILEMYPNNSRALLGCCEIQLLSGHPEMAASLAEEALGKINPLYGEEKRRAKTLLAKVARRMGKRTARNTRPAGRLSR